MKTHHYTPEEISGYLLPDFAALLIISTIAFMVYGINLCQLGEYLSVSAKRDHLFTKISVCIVMIFTSASTFYQVYYDWTSSISTFTTSFTDIASISNGTLIVLYSVVVMFVQFFWLSCIKKSMASNPRLSWMIITPLAFISLSSFANAIAIGVLTRTRPGLGGSFPTPLVSKLLRVVLGLDLGVDLSILIVLVTQLTLMKKNTIHHKTTISKLSWILIGTTITSTLILVAELVIEWPQPADGSGFIQIAITFAPLIPPVYSFGMLAVLNARSNLWRSKSRAPFQVSEGDSRLIPGLRFTVDLPDPNAEAVRSQRNRSG